MQRSYNKSQAQRDRKTQYDPEFWEIAVEKDTLNRFSNEQNLHYQSEDDIQIQTLRAQWVERVMPVVEKLMAEYLTPKQRQIVQLYFIEQKTVYEIAERLKISAPSVSQHLFGKSRNGKIVGGAIPKLRKKLEQLQGEKMGLPKGSNTDD